MRSRFLKILYIMAASLVVFSCSNSDEALVSSEKIKLKFILTLDNEASSSRTVSQSETRATGEEILGSDYENQIDRDQLHVLIYDAAGECKATLENMLIYKKSPNTYEFMGDAVIDEDVVGTTCKVMIFANCGNVNSNKISDLSGLQFDFDNERFNPDVQNKHLIPMWGVHTITPFNPKKGECLDLGTINVLRAMAKVDVKLDNSLAGKFKIKSVNLNNYNTAGKCLSSEYENISGFPTNNWDVLLNAIDDSHTSKSIPFIQSKNSSNFFYIYIPEYDNINQTKSTISVNLTDIEGHDIILSNNTISFKQYGDDSVLNVIRNNLYEYNIVGVNYGMDLSLTCTVKNWMLNEVKYDFSETVSMATDGLLSWTNGSYSSVDNSTHKLVLKSSTNAECKFLIQTPQGATWRAYLIPISGDNTNVDAFEFDGPSTGVVGEWGTLKIKVKNNDISGASQDNIAKLKIVVETLNHNIYNALCQGSGDEYLIIQKH